jgi:hypothetical protein
MFMMDAAVFDALVGCFDAKYTYWFIRPPQADPLITLPIGLPPHPSYPSAHSCVSGGSSGVLIAVFPQDAVALTAMAQEASCPASTAVSTTASTWWRDWRSANAVANKVINADLNHPNGLP